MCCGSYDHSTSLATYGLHMIPTVCYPIDDKGFYPLEKILVSSNRSVDLFDPCLMDVLPPTPTFWNHIFPAWLGACSPPPTTFLDIVSCRASFSLIILFYFLGGLAKQSIFVKKIAKYQSDFFFFLNLEPGGFWFNLIKPPPPRFFYFTTKEPMQACMHAWFFAHRLNSKKEGRRREIEAEG